MPSSKSPSALGIGPGKLPANVVTSTALLAPSGASSSPAAVSNLGIVSIVETVTLVNGRPVTYAFVDNRSRIYAIAGSLLADGQTFTLNDFANTPTVFEFDSNSSVTPGNVAVPFTGADSAATVATSIQTAINGVGGTLLVQAQTTTGATRNIVPLDVSVGFSETVANAGFTFFPDTAGTVYAITLPTAPNVGDVWHFVAEGNNTNTIAVSGAGVSGLVGGPFGSQSYIFNSAGWTTLIEKSTVQAVRVSTLLRPVSKNHTVLVDTTAGNVSVTLPTSAVTGDRITVVKSVASANHVTVLGASADDLIDGRAGNVGTSIFGSLASVTLVRLAFHVWATISETTEVIEIIDTVTLNTNTAAEDIYVLVHTADAAWAAGTKSVLFPLSGQTRVGIRITVADIDGSAATNTITIGNGGPPPTSGVRGVTSPAGTAAYTIATNYGSVSLVNRGGGVAFYSITNEVAGLVEDFTSWSRVDSRPDLSLARLTASPMLNWNQRKVALHAEFNGLITNLLPVEGFSAGGSMTVSSVASVSGTVGVMRCSVPQGQSGYLHLGSLPTQAIFPLSQMLGFRAILTLSTVNPGSDYAVVLGFGQDISDAISTPFGTDAMFLTVGVGGALSLERVTASTPTVTSLSTSLVVSNRYVLEVYFSGSTWDGYVNGVRHATALTGSPSAVLNFGMLVNGIGGAVPYLVDIDSFTIFTLDLGATRHNP